MSCLKTYTIKRSDAIMQIYMERKRLENLDAMSNEELQGLMCNYFGERDFRNYWVVEDKDFKDNN